jgi:hypothetical protein
VERLFLIDQDIVYLCAARGEGVVYDRELVEPLLPTTPAQPHLRATLS